MAEQHPGRSGFAEVGCVRLHYLDWGGHGAPVLCLPGITANAHGFAALAEELSPAHRVIAMDLRGRGESATPRDGYDVAVHAADAAGVLEELGAVPSGVIGWSLGARAALALAATRPALVERLVLVDPPVQTPPESVETLRAYWARLDDTYPSVDAFLERMRDGWRFSAWTPWVERFLRADVVEDGPGTVRHRVRRWVPEADLAAESRYPTRSFYGRVHCPTLILRAVDALVSDGDQVLGLEEAHEMAAAIPGARLVDIEDANHFSVMLGKHPRTLREIERFLRQPSTAVTEQ